MVLATVGCVFVLFVLVIFYFLFFFFFQAEDGIRDGRVTGVQTCALPIYLMFDLVALALQANMTRVFTFMVAAEVSGQTYNHIGVPDAFHPLSHHNNEQAKMDRLAKVQTYHTQVFAKFLDKLATMPDGDGTMLEHSLFLYGSNMSNSNAHNHYPLPTSIVGGWKTVKGGQHIVPPEHTPMANVLLTMLDRAGIPQDKLGDSTGKLLEV